MDPTQRRSPIATFAALTRAVREEVMPGSVRAEAYAILEALADRIGMPEFALDVDRLGALAADSAELDAAVRPFMPALEALSQSMEAVPQHV